MQTNSNHQPNAAYKDSDNTLIDVINTMDQSAASSAATKVEENDLRLIEERTRKVNEVVSQSCIPYLDAFFYCYSPANQISHYYFSGQIDPCTNNTDLVLTCFKLKGTRPLEEKEELIKHLQKRGVKNSTTGNIWSYRDDPKNDWPFKSKDNSNSSSSF